MRPRTFLVALAVVVGGATAVALGFWQLSRLGEKQALNRARRDSLAVPPVAFESLGAAPAPGRRVVLRGVYDPRLHLLLAARFHRGEPGVELVTPLELEGGVMVLVNRGWLASDDAVTARPQDYPEPGLRVVVGVAESIGRGVRGSAIRTIAADSIRVLSTSQLDIDSLAARLPYAVSALVVRQLPAPGLPEPPVRIAPAPLEESIHLGYAIQWFAIAAILLGGSAWLGWSRRRGARVSRTAG